MNLNKIEELAEKYLGDRKTHLDREEGYIYHHGQRTANLALELRKKIMPNDASKDDILYAAALFHDVGKGMSPHNETGAVLVRDILEDYCTAEELEEIATLVRGHNQRDNAEFFSTPVKILQDADNIENIGTLEVWLRFLESAHQEESIPETLESWTEEFDREEVAEIEAELNYEVAKQVLREKVKFVNNFIDRFKLEAEGKAYAFLAEEETVPLVAVK